MDKVRKSINKIINEYLDQEIETIFTRPEPEFGDLSTNIALQLAKKLNKNPKQIANDLAELLSKELSGIILKVSVAGPGFINIVLVDDILLDQLRADVPATDRSEQVVIIETNNPNPFKAMHVGHAYNSIMSDTIANLIENSGKQVHRVSYHGDVGTHVGKSMYSLLKYVDGNPDKLNDIKPSERNSFMSKMYSDGAKAYNNDEYTKNKIVELAKQSFTRDDPIYQQVYEMCKQWSFDQIDDILKRIGSKPVERKFLESEANDEGVAIVKANVPDVFTESDGALVFQGSKHGSFDNVFVSKQGIGLYGARDLGLIKLKDQYCHPQKSYIVTAEEQRDYFKGVIAAAELCMPRFKDITVNIPTGMVKLSTGKMSSRTGDVVEISWLFDQIAAAIVDRGGTPNDLFIAGVLRYQFLKVRVGGDVIFDINEAVSIEGNSGPYLQYAHARASSILSKANNIPSSISNIETSERMLVVKLTEYQDVILRSTNELLPHLICTYLYELSQEFNRFYEKNRVIGDSRQNQRLFLVRKYANTLKNGLHLLGIFAPDKM
ncbi:arginine--tRNA ligase [Candidatus Saccharibacteria bacterium]|nr:arginine--tRNA ligase [Candidatus Saccharibacteria bacterium]